MLKLSHSCPGYPISSFSSFLFICTVILAFLSPATEPVAKEAAPVSATETLPAEQVEAFLERSDHLVLESSTGNHPFTVELALTDAARAKGLMHRTKMADDHGMLFDFGQTAPVYMWMKNTYISLDMLFITDEGRIHHIVTGTTPLSQSIIGSGGSVRYVLEVKKGTVARTAIRPGDFVKHQLFTPEGLK